MLFQLSRLAKKIRTVGIQSYFGCFLLAADFFWFPARFSSPRCKHFTLQRRQRWQGCQTANQSSSCFITCIHEEANHDPVGGGGTFMTWVAFYFQWNDGASGWCQAAVGIVEMLRWEYHDWRPSTVSWWLGFSVGRCCSSWWPRSDVWGWTSKGPHSLVKPPSLLGVALAFWTNAYRNQF